MKKAYSPRDIEQKKFHPLQFSGEWELAFGYPEKTSLWTITGKTTSGKSSFAMQLAKQLCTYGRVDYVAYEEGFSKVFQERCKLFKMKEKQGAFRLIICSREELIERLKKPKSANFIIIDSFQVAAWTYEQAVELKEMFPRKSFIYICQEDKGEPMGKPAKRLEYIADMKVRVVGYKAMCRGRFSPDAGNYFEVWQEGILKTTNNIKNHENED